MRLVLENTNGRYWTITVGDCHSGKHENGDLTSDEALWVVAQFLIQNGNQISWLKTDQAWEAERRLHEERRAALNDADVIDPRF